VLRARPDVNCVIHTHPEHAVAFSSLGKQLQPMSNDGTMFSAGVPIFSETTDLIIDQGRGKAVARTLGDKGALILRNHGIVTAGRPSSTRCSSPSSWNGPAASRCWPNRPAVQAVRQGGGARRQARPYNRSDSQGNAFSYLVRRWHLRCDCEVPKEYKAELSNFNRTGYKGG